MIPGIFTSISGIRGEVPHDFSGVVLSQSIGGSAPLFALSSGMRSRDMGGTWSTTWIDENFSTGRLKVTATQSSATQTTLIVEDGGTVLPNLVYVVEKTGERLYVTGVSGNTISIQRGAQETTSLSAIISVNDYIQEIGSAFPEGSDSPSGNMQQGKAYTNYTQIIRTEWAITGTAEAISFYTGNKKQTYQKQTAVKHSTDIERAVMKGRRWVGTINRMRLSTMGGLEYYNTDNIVTVADGTATTYKTVNDWLKEVFKYSIDGQPQERLAFCGNNALAIINEVSKNATNMQIVPGANVFGFDFRTWVSPFGTINLLTHPMLNANESWSGDLWLQHPAAVELCYLRRTAPYTISGDGRDAQAGGLTTELSMEVRCSKTAGRMLNINLAG